MAKGNRFGNAATKFAAVAVPVSMFGLFAVGLMYGPQVKSKVLDIIDSYFKGLNNNVAAVEVFAKSKPIAFAMSSSFLCLGALALVAFSVYGMYSCARSSMTESSVTGVGGRSGGKH